MKPIALALVEDDPIVRESLTRFLDEDSQLKLIGTAASVEDFLQMIQGDLQVAPEILLLDIQLPGQSGIEGIPAIRKQLPATDIIMLTTFEESDTIFAALCAGACSYLSKRASLLDIRAAILTVAQGGSYMSPGIARKVVEYFAPRSARPESPLSPRQQEIVACMVDGKSYKMTAEHLGLSIDTVRTHIKHIYQALEINSKAELIRKMLEKGK